MVNFILWFCKERLFMLVAYRNGTYVEIRIGGGMLPHEYVGEYGRALFARKKSENSW